MRRRCLWSLVNFTEADLEEYARGPSTKEDMETNSLQVG